MFYNILFMFIFCCVFLFSVYYFVLYCLCIVSPFVLSLSYFWVSYRPLPPGRIPIAVINIIYRIISYPIIYHIISYHMFTAINCQRHCVKIIDHGSITFNYSSHFVVQSLGNFQNDPFDLRTQKQIQLNGINKIKLL
jgi:hypothetical protein